MKNKAANFSITKLVPSNPFRDFPREVGVLVFASFFVAVGFGIIAPTIPLFAKSFGVNNAQVGAIISAFAFARFASGLISGKLVDKFGERLVYSIGIGFVAISSFAAALSQSYAQLLIFRAAGGLGSSMFSVAAGSIILRAVNDDHRGRAQSLYNGSFLIGMTSGPAVGGLVSAISLRAPLMIYAVLLVISSAAGAILLRNSALAAKPTSSEVKNTLTIGKALQIRPYRYALVLSFATAWVLFGMGRSILPLFMVEKIHSSAAVIGFGFTISSIVQLLIMLRAGKFSDLSGRRAAGMAGTSLLLASTMTLAFTLHSSMYIFAMVLGGLGSAFLSTVPASIVGDVLEGKGGQVIGLFQMSGDAGAMVAPILLGAISDHYGFRPAFLVTSLLTLSALFIASRLPETRTSHIS